MGLFCVFYSCCEEYVWVFVAIPTPFFANNDLGVDCSACLNTF